MPRADGRFNSASRMTGRAGLFGHRTESGSCINRTGADRTQLAISHKKKTAPVTDVAVMDWKTRAVRNVTNETTPDHLWSGQVWSPDGKVIYATRVNAGFTDASVYRIDVVTAKKEELTPHEGQSRTSVSAISPDRKTLLVTA